MGVKFAHLHVLLLLVTLTNVSSFGTVVSSSSTFSVTAPASSFSAFSYSAADATELSLSRSSSALSRTSFCHDSCERCGARRSFAGGTNRYKKTAMKMAIRGPIRYSSSDWLNCLKTLPTSRILLRVRSQLLFVVSWTTLVQVLVTVIRPSPTHLAKLTALPTASLGAAVSLLLVFRNNASYDRFWEGRKVWTQVLATCRDLARLTYMHASKTKHQRLGRLIILLTIVLKQHLQGERVNKELHYLLSEKEILEVQALKNRPNIVLKMLGEEALEALELKAEEEGWTDWKKVHLATMHDSHFSHHIASLGQMIASCERLVKQPVPLSYSRHSSRFLTMFLFVLPFTMIEKLGWAMIPCMACISWGYLCLHEISHFIEEPFNKKLQLIPLASLIAYLRMEVAEIMATPGGPQIFPKEMEEVENEIISNATEFSRYGTMDAFLQYY